MNETFFYESFFTVEIFIVEIFCKILNGNSSERKPLNILKSAEVYEIQTETKRDYCDKIYTEKLYWITGCCLFFRLSLNCIWQSSGSPGSSQHGDW